MNDYVLVVGDVDVIREYINQVNKQVKNWSMEKDA